MDVTKTPLYRALKPAIRKEDHGNLRNELQRVADAKNAMWNADFNDTSLLSAFVWFQSPQGHPYWHALSDRLKAAGWTCA